MTKKILFLIIWISCSTAAHAALQIQHWKLDNDARVYLVEIPAIPIVDVSIEFDAGARRDPQQRSGTASLTNAMLARGLRETSMPDGTVEPALAEAQISDGFADIAAQRGGGAGSDRAGASLRTLSSAEERERAIALLARLLAQPSFPEDLLARDKARTIAAIKEELTKPAAIGNKAFWRLAYGDHPYAVEPSVESVERIAREDLVAFHAKHYVANRAVVVLVGDVNRGEADKIARQLTERLPRGEPLPALPPVPPAVAVEERIPHPASQAHIQTGMPALERGDPDFFALTVGNYTLGGGGFVSQLMHEVREKQGLAYSVSGYFSPMEQEGPFMISLQTKKEQADQALKTVREVLGAYLRKGPSPAELKAAKDNLIGSFALRIDSNRKILDNVAMIGYYQMPLDYLDTWTDKVAKVTAADIKAAFNRKISADKLTTVIVGSQSGPQGN